MTQEETKTLIDKALKGVHTEVPEILSYSEFLAAKYVNKTLTTLIKIFTKAERESFKEYIVKFNSLTSAEKFDLLFTVRNMNICAKFYKEEKLRMTDLIKKYRLYLRCPQEFQTTHTKEE